MPRPSQIRVVQFLNGTVRAGAEEVAWELARGLDPSRFRSYLVCPQSLLQAFRGDWNGTPLTGFPLTLESPWQWTAARRFLAFLRSERIDVVHAHMVRAATAAVPLARLAGVPVVVQTCHGREAWRQGWKQNYWLDRRIAGWSNATVAVSESTGAYLVQEKKLDPLKVKVIRNGRKLNGFHPDPARQMQSRAQLGITSDQMVIGLFGRLEEQKGHRFLIEALPSILAAVGPAKVLFVGDGALRQQLQQQVLSAGLGDCVVFTGYRGDSMELMAMCDLVVLPSLYEGMPLVPIEAATLEKAVVATAVDGTREVIVDGLTGRLVPPGQPEALAQVISELLLDRDRRQVIGQRAKARARELFSLQRQLDDTAVLYEDLLARSYQERNSGR